MVYPFTWLHLSSGIVAFGLLAATASQLLFSPSHLLFLSHPIYDFQNRLSIVQFQYFSPLLKNCKGSSLSTELTMKTMITFKSIGYRLGIRAKLCTWMIWLNPHQSSGSDWLNLNLLPIDTHPQTMWRSWPLLGLSFLIWKIGMTVIIPTCCKANELIYDKALRARPGTRMHYINVC